MNIDQYQAFIQAVPSINAHLGKLGIEMERPTSSHESSKDSKPSKTKREKNGTKKKNKAERANIDATSDENEDGE